MHGATIKISKLYFQFYYKENVLAEPLKFAHEAQVGFVIRRLQSVLLLRARF
jgi:hypothetical protein